jgi:hypothetical protein
LQILTSRSVNTFCAVIVPLELYVILGRDWNNDQLLPCAAELEMNVIDEYLHYIEPLYRRALHSKYHHLGGLDDYLTKLLISRKPADQRAALSRLRMIWNVLSDLFQVVEKQEQCRKAQVRLASHFLGQTTTHRGCEMPLISVHVLRQQLNSNCLSPFVLLVLALAQTSMKHRGEFFWGEGGTLLYASCMRSGCGPRRPKKNQEPSDDTTSYFERVTNCLARSHFARSPLSIPFIDIYLCGACGRLSAAQ